MRDFLAIVGILLCAAALGWGTFRLMTVGETLLGKPVRMYAEVLSRRLTFLLYRMTGPRLARLHLTCLAVSAALALVLGFIGLALWLPVAAVLPLFFLSRQVSKKRQSIDEQLPLWMMALSNSLKTSSALSDGIAQSAKLVPAPLSEELDLMLKELRLGANVDIALRAMKKRVRTRNMDAAVATLLVARDTGGDLPQVLEDTAAALREMDRLDGVLRTKTAEGKAQAYLMGAMPFALCGALHWIDPLWLSQLTESPIGYLIITISAILWVSSILLARKVLAVDM